MAKKVATIKDSAQARALLVGLTQVDSSKYPPDSNGNPWDGRAGCWGCDDDVANMRTLLEREGYTVTALIDQAATLKGVESALSGHRLATKAGDTFLLYYSGHGGQLPDQPGGDEIDGLDETLCLYDGQLRDDALNQAWIKFPKGSAIYMVADCCHSGSNFRALGRHQVQSVDFVRDLLGKKDMKAALLHLSGCRDPEVSIGAQDGGVFTKALISTWNKGRYPGTWDTFHDSISAKLPDSQRPQGNLYGPAKAAEALAKLKPFQPIKPLKLVGAPREIASRGVPAPRSLPTLEDLAVIPSTRTLPRGVLPPVAARDVAPSPEPLTNSLDILGEPGSAAFNRRVQERLAHFGVYDALAIDGRLGPLSDWALGEFKTVAGTRDEVGIGARTAQALLDADPDKLFPLNASGNTLAARVLRLMQAGGHWISRHPETFNIIYLEGIHHSDHEALRQVGDVTVHRDKNKDFLRTGDALDTGLFYINQHWGYDQPQSNLGRSSAGCLVGRTTAGHKAFMKLIKIDARHLASSGYRFTTTILDGSKLN